MTSTNSGYVQTARQGILDWMESVRCKETGWGRWKYHAAMTKPWALQASGIAIRLLKALDALGSVPEEKKQEAIEFLQSCQDPSDRLLKDPLETEADHQGPHNWEQIWGQRNGAALDALSILGAEPRLPRVKAQFADLNSIDTREWTLSLNWADPWTNGENWYRAMAAFLSGLPKEEHTDSHPALAPMFEAVESHVLDPSTGMPTAAGCSEDPPRAMAGLFKVMFGYHLVNRPVPNADRAIDYTLNLQHENGELGYRRNMCMNWDALWVLYHLNRQLESGYRFEDIRSAGNRACDMLMREYLKPDGAFAFHGDHCIVYHHSVRLCDGPRPISDMLGTMMCLNCLIYADEWNAQA